MDVRQLDILKPTIRNNVIKSLIVLSKYLGISNQFKESLMNYGVKLHKQDAVESFLRIMKANDSDILDWYVKAYDRSSRQLRRGVDDYFYPKPLAFIANRVFTLPQLSSHRLKGHLGLKQAPQVSFPVQQSMVYISLLRIQALLVN